MTAAVIVSPGGKPDRLPYIQVRHSPMPGFEWPIEMDRVHPLGWLAVLLLVADVIVDRVWQARRTDAD